ncbi:MAG: 4Fe-4S dicluster domain-containing protein [Eggerthella lenta]
MPARHHLDGRPGLVANRLRSDARTPWQARNAQGVQRGLHRLPECAKTCPTQSITVENNLARIDTDTCIGCGTCIEVCLDPCHQQTGVPAMPW